MYTARLQPRERAWTVWRALCRPRKDEPSNLVALYHKNLLSIGIAAGRRNMDHIANVLQQEDVFFCSAAAYSVYAERQMWPLRTHFPVETKKRHPNSICIRMAAFVLAFFRSQKG